MSRTLLGVTVAVVLAPWPALGQAPSLLDRKIDQYRGLPVSVYMPSDSPSSLILTLRSLAGAAEAPLGVELQPDPATRPTPVRGGRPAPLPLSGLTLRQALDRVISAAPAYAWHEAGGLIEVAPAGVTGSFLDTIVPAFDLKDAPLAEALASVQRVFDKSYPTPHPPTYVGSSGDPNANSPENLARLTAVFTRPIAVSMKSGTVRQILDAIAVAHGRLYWFVRYRPGTAHYETSSLAVISFDGFGWNVDPRSS